MNGASDSPLLRAGQVHLWQLHLDPGQDEARRRLDVLEASERDRARRFRSDLLGSRFVNARGALRLLIGQYLSIDPKSVPFRVLDRGKPCVDGNPLYFSLSHTGPLALVAVASDRRVGVDMERIRPLPDLIELARRFFAREEYAALSALPEDVRQGAFFAVWTRKEAFVKATGAGIAALRTFEVSVSSPARLIRPPERADHAIAEQWRLQDVVDIAGHAACVAAEGHGWLLVRQAGWP